MFGHDRWLPLVGTLAVIAAAAMWALFAAGLAVGGLLTGAAFLDPINVVFALALALTALVLAVGLFVASTRWLVLRSLLASTGLFAFAAYHVVAGWPVVDGGEISLIGFAAVLAALNVISALTTRS